jgi:hypothetical protein
MDGGKEEEESQLGDDLHHDLCFPSVSVLAFLRASHNVVADFFPSLH